MKHYFVKLHLQVAQVFVIVNFAVLRAELFTKIADFIGSSIIEMPATSAVQF